MSFIDIAPACERRRKRRGSAAVRVAVYGKGAETVFSATISSGVIRKLNLDTDPRVMLRLGIKADAGKVLIDKPQPGIRGYKLSRTKGRSRARRVSIPVPYLKPHKIVGVENQVIGNTLSLKLPESMYRQRDIQPDVLPLFGEASQ